MSKAFSLICWTVVMPASGRKKPKWSGNCRYSQATVRPLSRSSASNVSPSVARTNLAFALAVAGLVLLSLYGPNSPLGLQWAFTPSAVTLALAFVTLPFVVRTVQPVLEELETDVEEAAASLGAKRSTIFMRGSISCRTPPAPRGPARRKTPRPSAGCTTK